MLSLILRAESKNRQHRKTLEPDTRVPPCGRSRPNSSPPAARCWVPVTVEASRTDGARRRCAGWEPNRDPALTEGIASVVI
jgi:hypothetical protein